MDNVQGHSGLPQQSSMTDGSATPPAPVELALERLSPEWFSQLGEIVRAQISESTASVDVLLSVQRHNPDSFWGLFRREGSHKELAGFYGQLLLNERGHRALKDCTLNRLNPQRDLLAVQCERPDAVYIWCIVAKKKLAALQAALLDRLPHLAGVPHYTCLATADSFSVGKRLGFMPVSAADDRLGGIFRAPDAMPRMWAQQESIKIKVVETASELEQAKALRAIVFVGEQRCPYAEEFDGNDSSAQHLIGFVNGEPAATMRLRYFSGFVKWERYCVLPQFRKTSVKNALIEFAIGLARQKGYQRVYFQAEKVLEGFWRRYGFAPMSGERVVHFSDREYLEFEREIRFNEQPISLTSDPMVLNRVEGRWSAPGILDRSAGRFELQQRY